MKLTKSIMLCATLTASSLIVSGEEIKEAGAQEPKAADAAVKIDTPDTLTDEMIVQMNALAAALAAAKDKASAEASVKKIETVAARLDGIAVRMDKLETPTEEKKKALDAKMDKASKAMEKKMEPVMQVIMGNPEVASTLGPAMQKFGERMKKNDIVFERFGKKK